jgi:hypothetical protein
MSSSGEGGPHALRSRVEPAYLGTADPGYNGGGTVFANDPQSMMSNYENIFGPAVREIKWDEQRHKRHQRWHLPDALKGSNAFLTDRVDGLITDATSSPFTKNILPYVYMDQPDRKIKWNVYSFDEGIASRVPYESAARVLPQTKRSFAGYAVRQGLAIAMEHNFMMSPQGMDNFRKQLMQLVGSIQLTNDLDVHMALLYAPSYQKHMDEKYYDTSRTVNQNCRMYVDLFGFMQKNENALDYLIEDAKNHLTAWGSKAPTFMLCNGSLTRQLTMTPEKTNYITAGPDGKRKLAQGPDLPSYRGLSIINTRQFSLEAGTAPRDMLRRRVRVSEYYRITWENTNLLKRYEFYDQSRDSMFYLSWQDLYKASFPKKFTEVNKIVIDTSDTQELYTNFTTAFDNDNVFKITNYLNNDEIKLAMLLGFFAPHAHLIETNRPKFCRDLDLIVEINVANQDKPRYKTLSLKKERANTNPECYGYFLTLLFLFFRENFGYMYDEASADNFNTKIQSFITLFPSNADATMNTCVKLIKHIQDQENADEYMKFARQYNVTETDNIQFLAVDLMLFRPCIEHYMLGVIMGRGGGPEELGATYWGQTELSCYDDSQHGIWGMSYKYHERSIVTNERNLIRVYDVCFDGYCGGNDSRILKWERTDLEIFKSKASAYTEAYDGPSMLVMALPPDLNRLQSFPNPMIIHQTLNTQQSCVPDRNLRSNNYADHAPYLITNNSINNIQTLVYGYYYRAAGMDEWQHSNQSPGHLTYQNETDPYMYSFHGHMATFLDGHKEETQGSGHLGPNFVGVASVREGRGMMPRGMPSLTHLV